MVHTLGDSSRKLNYRCDRAIEANLIARAHSRGIRRLLKVASHSRRPLRNRIIVLLNLRAGLRASEITLLDLPMRALYENSGTVIR